MSIKWQQTILDRLHAAQSADGGWGYRPRGKTCAEPTALACMALSPIPSSRTAVQHGLAWLAHHQRDDGGIPIAENVNVPCWPTGLAVLAWLHPPTVDAGDHTKNIERAITWLCQTAGLPVPYRPDVFGHDTRLIGWSWVQGTHSWVEPTAYATWALRQAGLAKHKRTREGIQVLLDRVLTDGGWNYGNTRVLDQPLQAFPGTTGLTLRALAGETRTAAIDRSITYLSDELHRVRAPLTLGWGVLGLTAWREQPPEAADWLAECAASIESDEPSPVYDALLLMAGHAVTSDPIAYGGAAGE